MARIKYYDQAKGTWEYADAAGSGGGGGDKQVFTAIITDEVGRLVCDMTASEIINTSRNGVVRAEYTDLVSGETRIYQYAKQTKDGRAVFEKAGYIESGVPKQTLIYVDYAGNVTTETRDADMIKSTEKGAVDGVASLGPDGKVPAGQLPKVGGTGKSVQVKLVKSAWANGRQTVSNPVFKATGYDYTVAPDPATILLYSAAGIYAESVAEGTMVFRSVAVPKNDINVNIRREETEV